jgi:hypothetical protein
MVMSGLMAMHGSASHAQFVKGNEAVKVVGGNKQVETPPLPKTGLAKPCPAAQAGCAGGGWNMVETSDGLMECTEIYARGSTCQTSTYGKEKRSRVWIVKTGPQWMQCQHPNLTSKCVSTKSLPYPAFQ